MPPTLSASTATKLTYSRWPLFKRGVKNYPARKIIPSTGCPSRTSRRTGNPRGAAAPAVV